MIASRAAFAVALDKKSEQMNVVSKRVLNEMSGDYSDVARALRKMTKHLGDDANEAVSEASRTFAHAASDLAEKIKTQSESVAKRAGAEVRERPIAAIAIAAAVVGLTGYAIVRARAAH